MTISIIIPVLHEQERINERISHLKPFARQIIIVDGDPAGSTLLTITGQGITRLIAPRGRGSQLAAGAAVADGDILLLVHADTCLPDNAAAAIAQAVAQGSSWGAFRLGINANGLAWRILERAVDLRCTLFSLPYGDQAIFVTRAALAQVGGIPAIPLMEDVALVRSLKKAGQPFTLLPERVRTSARRWQKDGMLWRTLKNWWLLCRYLAGTPPEKLAGDY